MTALFLNRLYMADFGSTFKLEASFQSLTLSNHRLMTKVWIINYALGQICS